MTTSTTTSVATNDGSSREVLLDVVIAVHSPTRRVDRAVASVLACPQARAIVVCHGIGIAHAMPSSSWVSRLATKVTMPA